jgi:hypothetical protein
LLGYTAVFVTGRISKADWHVRASEGGLLMWDTVGGLWAASTSMLPEWAGIVLSSGGAVSGANKAVNYVPPPLADSTWVPLGPAVYTALTKRDHNGVVEWARGVDTLQLYGVAEARDEGLLLAGQWREHTQAGERRDLAVMCCAANGDRLWRTVSPIGPWSAAWGVAQTPSADILCVGAAKAGDSSASDVVLLRLAASGAVISSRTLFRAGDEKACCVLPSSGGEAAIVGTVTPEGHATPSIWLLQVTGDGDTLRTHIYGGAADDSPNDIVRTKDGGYLVAGYTASYGLGGTDAYLIKTDCRGNCPTPVR